MKKIDGFTIIELVVVVGIIGVLSVILAPALTGGKTAATAALVEKVGKTSAQEMSRLKDTIGMDMITNYSMMGMLGSMLYSQTYEDYPETAPPEWINDGLTQAEWDEYRAMSLATQAASKEAMTGSLTNVVQFKFDGVSPPSWVVQGTEITVSPLMEMVDGVVFKGGQFVMLDVPGEIAKHIITNRKRAFEFKSEDGYAINMGDMIAIDYGAGNGNTEGIISLHYRIN